MPPTLATRLGTTTHVSTFLRKARKAGLMTPDDLSNLAAQRGCRHYWHEGVPEGELATREQLSDEELAIALLNVALPFDPHAIRCGAAMVSAEGNSPKRLAWLAKLERSERVLRYVAECGKKYEPENVFWDELLALLPEFPPLFDGALPHPTRFIAMTGFIPGVGRKFVTEWQRPQKRKSQELLQAIKRARPTGDDFADGKIANPDLAARLKQLAEAATKLRNT